MHRRTFSKLTAIAALGAFAPLLSNTSLVQTISREELFGKGSPLFTKTDDYQLRPEAALAFEKMKSAAAGDGIHFKVVSSYRSFEHQNRIWERKYRRYTTSGFSPIEAIEKIIQYSTIPGTSRHHWGTDIDIVQANANVKGDLLVPSKFHGTGPFCAFKEWMDELANAFGFYLVYTDLPSRKGFNYEPWHYSYMPLSKVYLKAYQNYDVKLQLQTHKLLGSEYFSDTFIEDYLRYHIKDINPLLL